MNGLVCRTVLYMPASNARALEKATKLDSDAIAIDLEDSVEPSVKVAARDAACTVIKNKPYGDRFVVLRLNGLDTQWHVDDVIAACGAKPDAVLLPKVESATQIESLATELARHGGAGITIWAMIETPIGISNASAIAAACANHSSYAACCLGNNDLTIAAGMQQGEDRCWLVPWMMHLLLACKTHGVHCFDGVFNKFSDEAGFESECRQGAAMGFDGKTLIHPSQILPANRIFSPSAQSIKSAKKIIEAFNLTENQAKNAIQLDGEMVERLHLHWAQRILSTVQHRDDHAT